MGLYYINQLDHSIFEPKKGIKKHAGLLKILEERHEKHYDRGYRQDLEDKFIRPRRLFKSDFSRAVTPRICGF